MDWMDRLKGWADDAVDYVEDNIEDAGDWIEETVDDIAGENSWAAGLVDKAGDAIGGADGVTSAAWGLLGDRVEGTWAESAYDVADSFDEEGVGGLVGAASGLIGGYAEGTWAEDAWDTASGLVQGGPSGIADMATGFIGDKVAGTWAEGAWGKVDDAVSDGAESIVGSAVGAADDYVSDSWAGGAWGMATDLLADDAPNGAATAATTTTGDAAATAEPSPTVTPGTAASFAPSSAGSSSNEDAADSGTGPRIDMNADNVRFTSAPGAGAASVEGTAAPAPINPAAAVELPEVPEVTAAVPDTALDVGAEALEPAIHEVAAEPAVLEEPSAGLQAEAWADSVFGGVDGES